MVVQKHVPPHISHKFQQSQESISKEQVECKQRLKSLLHAIVTDEETDRCSWLRRLITSRSGVTNNAEGNSTLLTKGPASINVWSSELGSECWNSRSLAHKAYSRWCNQYPLSILRRHVMSLNRTSLCVHHVQLVEPMHKRVCSTHFE